MVYGRYGLIILFFVCRSAAVLRADTIPQFSCGSQMHFGFIIPHSKAIEPVSYTNPYGIEVTFNKLNSSLTGRKVFNAYWISGIQAGYYNFQYPDVLGGAYKLTLFAEPILFFSDRILLTLRGGAGLSYHTSIYDEINNPLNQFFCTRISFPLYVSTTLKLKLNSSFFLTLSGNYNHISNGGIKQPNLGMNFPTASVGLEYFYEPYKVPEKVPKKVHIDFNRRLYYTFEVLTAIRVLDKTELYPEMKTMAFGIHARAAKPLGSIYSLSVGAELVFDGYFKETIKREGSDIDYKRLALTCGQDLKFGQVFFSQYFGFYVYSQLIAPRWYYQKYELAYKFKSGIMTGIFLKAHLHEAEMMGVTLSWMMYGNSKN